MARECGHFFNFDQTLPLSLIPLDVCIWFHTPGWNHGTTMRRVTQNMLRTYEGKYQFSLKKIRDVTALNLIKYL